MSEQGRNGREWKDDIGIRLTFIRVSKRVKEAADRVRLKLSSLLRK